MPERDEPIEDDRTVHQGGDLEMTGSGVRRRAAATETSTNHGGELELTATGVRPVEQSEEEHGEAPEV